MKRLFLYSFLLFFTNTVFATVYVVDDDFVSLPAEACEQPAGAVFGNDLSSTIALAAADTDSPHTIRLCVGAYNETGSMLISNANLINLTIEGVFQAPETNLNVDVVGNVADIFDVRVDGVTFRGFETTAGNFAFENTAAGTNLTFEDVTITNPSNDALRLNALGVTINDVEINNAGSDGIQANTSSGDFSMTDFTVNTATGFCTRLRGSGPNNISNVNFSNCGSFGLSIEANGDNTTINNLLVNTTTSNDCLSLRGDNTTLNNITLNNCGALGLDLNINGGGTLLNISDVTVNTSNSFGILIQNANAANPGDVVIDNLSVADAGNTGIIFRDISNGQITDLSVVRAAQDGIQVRGGDFSSYSVSTLTQNLIQDSGDMGLLVSNNANDNTFNDFLIQDNVDDGINANNSRRNIYTDITISIDDGVNEDGVVITNSANRNVFNNVNVSDTSGDCVRLDDGNRLTYQNSTLIRCGDYGIDASPAAETIMLLENIDISDTVDDGLNVSDFAATNVQIRDITVTNSQDRGINLLRTSNLVIQDFVITNTANDGLFLNDTDNATFSVSSLTNNVITGSGNATDNNGITITTGSDGNSFNNVQVINSFDDAIRMSASLNNSFNEIEITNPAANSDDGIIISTNSTGNSFTDIDVDAVNDDCILTTSNNTTFSNVNLSNCNDFGLVANVAAGADLNITNINIQNTGDDAILIQNFTLGTGVNVSGVTVLNSGDIGMHLNVVDGGSYSDLNIQGSTRFGLLLNNADNTSITVNTLTENVLSGNDDGLQLQGGSDGNTLANFLVSNNTDDGVVITNANNNNISDSDINLNGDVGVLVTNNATGNTISNNIIVENTNRGARIFNTGVNANNTFFDNCFRNPVNADDNEPDAVNNFDNGTIGNFWGSFPVDGTGFSESCVDDRAIDDDICDSTLAIPTTGGSIDNFPLQKCDDFNPQLMVTKTSQPVDDPVNTTNHKAIPGATVRYTVTLDNQADVRGGMAEDIVVNDNLDSQITLDQDITWVTDSMIRTSPDYDLGTPTGLTDATGDDDADFDDTSGNRTINALCGDLNSSEQCTISYDVFVN